MNRFTMKTLFKPLMVAMAVSLVCTPGAEANTLEAVKQKFNGLIGQGETRNKPVEVVRISDGWGSEPVKPVGLRPEQRIDERTSDSRHYDDRVVNARRPSSDSRYSGRRYDQEHQTASATGWSTSDSQTQLRQEPSRTLAAEARNHARSDARTRKSDSRDTRESRLTSAKPVADTPAKPSEDRNAPNALCVNVARVWEGAQALAQRGQEDRAYDAYLKLLSSCTDEKEIDGTAWQVTKNLGPANIIRLLDEPVMSSPKLEKAAYALNTQRMYNANKAKDVKTALSVSRAIRSQMVTRMDAGALVVAGWLEQGAGHFKEAEAAFRHAIRFDKTGNSQREGLVQALLSQGKLSQAMAEMERVDSSPEADALRTQIKVAQAREAYESNEAAKALKLMAEAERMGAEIDDGFLAMRAWALRADGKPEQAAQLFEQLLRANPDKDEYRKGVVESYISAQDYVALQRLTAEKGVMGEKAREALALRLAAQGRRIEAASLDGTPVEGLQGGIAAGVAVRNKSGDRGQGQLTTQGMPSFSVSAAVTGSTRVELEGGQVRVDDGVHNTEGRELRARVVSEGDTRVVAGLGVSEVGGSTEMTGELKIRQYVDKGGYVEAGAVREPVMESVRSYAGVQSNGKRTGRAIKTGVVASGQHPYGGMRMEWSLAAGSVTGENIQSNAYADVRAGVTKDIERDGFSWLTIGPEIRLGQWARDENQFKGAFGGYFSPTSYSELGLKFNALTLEGSNSIYKATGFLGYLSRSLSYGTEAGLGAELDLTSAWLLSPYLIARAGATFRTTPGYVDTGMHFGVMVPFERRTKLYGSDLLPVRAPGTN